MSAFENTDQLRAAVLGILKEAHDAYAAKRWIRSLLGPSTACGGVGGMVNDDFLITPRGMYFDIPGDITVHFREDGSREATFTIVREHDDMNPELISVRWTPDPPRPLRHSRRRTVAGRRAQTIIRLV